MGSAYAHNRESAGAHGVVSGRLAPAGRVIRAAGKDSFVSVSQPANRDLPGEVSATGPKRGFVTVACIGLLTGVLLSLCAPSVDVLTTGNSSQELLSAVKEGISERDDDVQGRDTSSAKGGKPQLQRTLSKDDRELNQILLAAKVKPQTQSVRLAAYHIEPAATISRAPVHSDSSIAVLRQDRTTSIPPSPPRNLVARVHSVIKKYSPKHTTAAQLAHAIVQESSRQGVDPLFVAAVIKSESAFNTLARSHKGAQGLMQIMPATGAWIVEQHDLPKGKLTDPGHNLRLGVSYLKYLEETYRGNRIFALVAYNWGPGHVDSASGGRRRIPKECMKYALKIMQDYRRWSSGVI